MKFPSFGQSITLFGAALLLTAACAGAPDGSDGVTSENQALGRPTWGAFPNRVASVPRRPPAPSGSGAGGTTSSPPSTGGTTSSPPPSNDTPQNIDAIIAAARTPDGQAIPQPAGPNGQCPAVVVALGFWACPTLGQTCSYVASGVTHACTCNRVDGEGQTPAWVCN